jgi:TonB family protein
MKKLTGLIAIVSILLLPATLIAQQAGKGTGPAEKGNVASRLSDSVAGSASRPVDGAAMVQDKQEKKAPPYDQAPEAKTMVQPKYPESATKAGTEGTVWTNVSIDETGKVTKVTISKSDAEIFNQPSIDAAMQWVFKPAMKDGKPIATEVAIPFRYKMQGQAGDGPTDYTQGRSSFLISVMPGSGYRVTHQQPYLIGQSPTVSNEWYPESAQKDKFEGLVMLKLNVNLYGRVDRVEVEGHAREDVDSAAVRLARTWTFIPGQSNGMPEKTIIRVPVYFFPLRPRR